MLQCSLAHLCLDQVTVVTVVYSLLIYEKIFLLGNGFNIREVKHHYFVKRQSRICTT